MTADPGGTTRRRPDGPTLGEAVEGITAELARGGIESARVEAERLVALVSGLERGRLRLQPGRRLDGAEARRLARETSRRLSGEPLQHIEGEVEFRQVRLVSDPRALIPRPETEQLLDYLAAVRPDRGWPEALDIGTGSGAIALGLLTEGLAERVVGLDVSGEALDQAEENRARVAGIGERFELIQCGRELWEAVEGRRFSLVVSNPPYVRTGDIEDLARDVRDGDPACALDGGPDGLDILRIIAAGLDRHLAPGGHLALEIGADQGASVVALLEAAAPWAWLEVRTDLAGRERFVFGQRASEAP